MEATIKENKCQFCDECEVAGQACIKEQVENCPLYIKKLEEKEKGG